METRQDSFSDTVSSLLERKVRNWLSGVIREMNRTSPVQQWLDSLPAEVFPEEAEDQNSNDQVKDEPEVAVKDQILDDKEHLEDTNLDIPSQQDGWKRKSVESELPSASNQPTVKKKLQRDYSIQSEGCSPKPKTPLLRDYSLQSDASGSSGSSVLNVLGARKVDAESVLLDMGFGPSEKQQKLQRIPDRFLVPSKLKGISTEKFIKDEQHSMRMHDCGVFGYRGLTEYCSPVCRFMRPVTPSACKPFQIPEIAIHLLKSTAEHKHKPKCFHCDLLYASCFLRIYEDRLSHRLGGRPTLRGGPWDPDDGNPHVPPSTIVSKIMDCILKDDVCREQMIARARYSVPDIRSSVLNHALHKNNGSILNRNT